MLVNVFDVHQGMRNPRDFKKTIIPKIAQHYLMKTDVSILK